jgi:hypothetical protein
VTWESRGLSEVGFPPVPQRMPVVRAAGAATLGDEEEQVVGGISE